jgi:hypothetical protein
MLALLAAPLTSTAQGEILSAWVVDGSATLSLCEPLPASVTPIAALAAVVRLFEPALPVMLLPNQIALEPSHPDVQDLRYLRERRVFNASAEVEPMSQQAWQSAFDVIAGWYDIEPVAVGDPLDPSRRANDVAALVREVALAVRPLALVAWSEDPVVPGAAEVGFLGLVWNWSVYPRLIVWRPVEARAPAAGGPLGVAQQLSNCAFEVGHYVAARASVARDLFLARNTATMWLVGSDPQQPDWPREVPVGEEVAVFDFQHPWVAELDTFAAVFVGERAPIVNFLSLLPQLRTNLSPLTIPRYLAIPDSAR